MRKQAYRDYATEAFRFWARTGTAAAYREHLLMEAAADRSDAPGAGISKPTEAALLRVEDALDNAMAELKDLEAVDHTRAILIASRDGDLKLKALELVYMAHPQRFIRRGEIHDRVIRTAIALHCGEATIYRWLREARDIFAAERGLRKN